MRKHWLPAWLALVVGSVVAGSAAAQVTLQEAAERARAAWLAHDPQALVGQSATLVLQIPGADLSSPLGRAQAVELLRRYLRPSAEKDLVITAIREVEAGRGFVELDRRFVVAGTADERHGTVFLRFRRLGARWLLAELRSAP